MEQDVVAEVAVYQLGNFVDGLELRVQPLERRPEASGDRQVALAPGEGVANGPGMVPVENR